MQPTTRDINGAGSLAAAIWLGIVGSFVLLVLPVFIGTLMEYRNYSSSQAGWIASADLIGFALASLVAFRIIRKISWKSIVGIGLLMIIVGDTASIFVTSFETLFVIRLLLSGFGAGLVIAVPYALLGDTHNPERNTGIYFSFNVLGGAIGLFLLPSVVAQAGADGMFAALALTGVIALPVALIWLPDSGRTDRAAAIDLGSTASRSVLIILFAIAIFNFGLGGVWAFTERIGLESGLTANRVGQVLSFTYLISILGSSTAAWQADRFGYFKPYAVGIAVLCVALVLLILRVGPWSFVAALSLVNFGWNYSLTYQFSAVYNHDVSGRMSVLIILVQALGLMLGPGVAGSIAELAGYNAGLALGIVCCVLSLLLFAVARTRVVATKTS